MMATELYIVDKWEQVVIREYWRHDNANDNVAHNFCSHSDVIMALSLAAFWWFNSYYLLGFVRHILDYIITPQSNDIVTHEFETVTKYSSIIVGDFMSNSISS